MCCNSVTPFKSINLNFICRRTALFSEFSVFYPAGSGQTPRPHTESLNLLSIIMVIMTAQDYLLKFRKVNTSESPEKLFDHLNYSLTDDRELMNMYRAADHRRAELVSGGKLFNLGEVPKSVWRYVV